MPTGAIVRHVHEQSGQIRLWMQVDKSQSMTNRYFQLYGTGKELPASEVDNDRLVYIGTFHLSAHTVGHLFEVLPKVVTINDT